MNIDLQKAAVRRCASEITRCIWYYRAWKSLQYVERADTANFIRLSELALYDQMIAHAVKVLHRREENGGGERTGLWALRLARGPEFDRICGQRSIDLDVIHKVGIGLRIIRNKTLMHLDPAGVLDPKSIWTLADITFDQFVEATEGSHKIICELYQIIRGESFESQNYDGSDAKVIAEHAERHGLLF